MRKGLLVVVGLLGAALLALLLWAFLYPAVRFSPPEREGPPALVTTPLGPVFWVLQKQEERRQRRVGSGRWSAGTLYTDHWYHFNLTAIDPATLRPLWSKRLRSVHQRDGGRSARARLLGPDGDAVWLFLVDGPLALSATDASVALDGAGIVARDPSLAGVLATELERYAFLDGLLLTTADARRLLLTQRGGAAQPFEVTDANRDAVLRAEYSAQQWNGAWRTQDFLVRTGRLGGEWLGLYTADEAKELAADVWGESLREPERVRDGGELARRRFWRARIEAYRPWADRAAVDRVAEMLPVKDSGEYLQGGMLAAAGRREPLALADPHGLLVVHRTRVDDAGRLVFTRIDDGFRELWRRELPLANLAQRWELPDGRLLLYGSTPWRKGERSGIGEYLLRLDPRNGEYAAWDVIAGAPLAP
jgi:hypothetical protein